MQYGVRMLVPAVQTANLASKELPWDQVFAVLDDGTRPDPADIPLTGKAKPFRGHCDERIFCLL